MTEKEPTPEKKPKGKGGRPLAPIDENELIKLYEIGCTDGEIAHFFGVDRTTIAKRFSHLALKHRAMGRTHLRRLQWQTANNGSERMQIHLGKHLLGQTDKVETTVTDLAALAASEDGQTKAVKAAALAKIERVLAASKPVLYEPEDLSEEEDPDAFPGDPEDGEEE